MSYLSILRAFKEIQMVYDTLGAVFRVCTEDHLYQTQNSGAGPGDLHYTQHHFPLATGQLEYTKV